MSRTGIAPSRPHPVVRALGALCLVAALASGRDADAAGELSLARGIGWQGRPALLAPADPPALRQTASDEVFVAGSALSVAGATGTLVGIVTIGVGAGISIVGLAMTIATLGAAFPVVLTGLVVMGVGATVAVVSLVVSVVGAVVMVSSLRDLGVSAPLTGLAIAGAGLGALVGGVLLLAEGVSPQAGALLLLAGTVAFPAGMISQVILSNRAFKDYKHSLEVGLLPVARPDGGGAVLVARFR